MTQTASLLLLGLFILVPLLVWWVTRQEQRDRATEIVREHTLAHPSQRIADMRSDIVSKIHGSKPRYTYAPWRSE